MQIRYRRELPELMRQLDLPMIAAEIGCAESLHAADLLRNGIEQLFLVDNWGCIPDQKGDGGSPQSWHEDNYKQTLDRMQPFGQRAIILKGMSAEMAKQVPDESLGLVYLDGDHSYEGVITDLITWFPKLVNGGIMSGHDFRAKEYGVEKAVYDFTYKNIDVSVVYTIPEDKDEDAGFWFQKL